MKVNLIKRIYLLLIVQYIYGVNSHNNTIKTRVKELNT